MTAGALVIGAEGVVLRMDAQNYPSSKPLQEGLDLVLMLGHFPTTRTLLLVNTENYDGAVYWAKMNGLLKVEVVPRAPEDRTESDPVAQWHGIQQIRSNGPINLVITAHPQVYLECLSGYQPVLLYGRRGAVGSPEAGPSWQKLQSQVRRRREALVEETYG
jgi:hypothetical protein